MAIKYSPEVKLLLERLKAVILADQGVPVFASIRYVHGKGEYVPVTVNAKKMTWVWKGVYGGHGNQPGVWGFLAAFMKNFRGMKGKIEDLPAPAFALKLAKIRKLTYKPGRHKVYTAERTIEILRDLYGDLAEAGIRAGERAAMEVRGEVEARLMPLTLRGVAGAGTPASEVI